MMIYRMGGKGGVLIDGIWGGGGGFVIFISSEGNIRRGVR